MTNNFWWVVALVVLVVLAVGVLLTGPKCVEFAGGQACETVKYIPGIALGIPGEQAGFETVEFRSVDISLPAKANVLQATVNWLRAGKYNANTLVRVRAETTDKKSGALAVCLAPGLKEFASQILARLGFVGNPQQITNVNTLECHIFYGGVS